MEHYGTLLEHCGTLVKSLTKMLNATQSTGLRYVSEYTNELWGKVLGKVWGGN